MTEATGAPPVRRNSAFGGTLARLAWHANYASERFKYGKIFEKYQAYTMIPKQIYTENLALAKLVDKVPGHIVECGTWRGGMIAGIADVLGENRGYYLYDSFEGLPAPTSADGEKAVTYQSASEDPLYFDNCTASEDEAKAAMQLSVAVNYRLIKGWFDDTLPSNPPDGPIALLRLDGDWYESTKCILDNFAPRVVSGGMVLIDDYYYWQGCTRAVNEYAFTHDWQIKQSRNGVCFVEI
jgi:O-methyltransferase